MVINGLKSGLDGLQKATRRLDEIAFNVAQLTSSFEVSLSPEAQSGVVPRATPDLATEMVGQITAVAAYKANLKSIQTADEVSGVLISILGNR